MSLQFLNLSKINPLDILLTSGDGVFSQAIKIATSAKGFRQARFSHAALMLAPSVSVEALTEEGIVLNNLISPLENPHSRINVKADKIGSAEIQGRWINGRLELFSPLRGVNQAMVLRYINEDGETLAREDAYRQRQTALDRLVDLYLKQYSNMGRLVKPIVKLPNAIEDWLEWFIAKLEESKPEPGPFCSELVCILMDTTFGLGSGESQRVAPSEFAWKPEYLIEVEDAVRVSSVDTLPGTPCDLHFMHELRNFLWFPSAHGQSMSSRILESMNYMPQVAADNSSFKTFDEWTQFYAKNAKEFRATLATRIVRHLCGETDLVWQWIQGSNQCILNCPTNKREIIAFRARLAAARGAPMSPERLRIESDTRCAKTTSCIAGFEYDEVIRNYKEKRDAREAESGLGRNSDA